MGLDVNAVLVYGIQIPEDLLIDDAEYTAYDFVESLVYDDDAPYKTLDLQFTSCDSSVCFLVAYIASQYWTNDPINIKHPIVDPDKYNKLLEFCRDYEIKEKPSWYLFAYTSY